MQMPDWKAPNQTAVLLGMISLTNLAACWASQRLNLTHALSGFDTLWVACLPPGSWHLTQTASAVSQQAHPVITAPGQQPQLGKQRPQLRRG